MKQIIRVRKSTQAFGRGTLEFLASPKPPGSGICPERGQEKILVVNNLSSSAQAAELDLREFKGAIPIEMFGGNPFPRVGDLPYLLTLGPYQFFWFRLRRF